MQCPQCHYENDQAVKFCEECGTRLIQSCPSCGHEVRPTAKFCPECGMSLAGKQKAKGKEQKAKR
jgi:hypothetical protein